MTGLVHPDGVVEQALDGRLLEGRVPVLGVGSNASSTVLRRKLMAVLADGLPVGTATVVGLAVGHSAHVSAGGYVPAAPVAHPGAVTQVAVAWLSEVQLEMLDVTEPNYVRVELGLSCTTNGGDTLRRPQVYDSRHGVLADNGLRLPLSPQPEVLRWLRQRLAARQLTFSGPDFHDALRVAETRERIREAIADGGLTAPSGIC